MSSFQDMTLISVRLCANSRSNWLNKQRSMACQQPISNFRQLRKSFSESHQSEADEAASAAGGKKRRKPKRLSQEILSKTDEEIIAGIDFSCLDTPRRAGTCTCTCTCVVTLAWMQLQCSS